MSDQPSKVEPSVTPEYLARVAASKQREASKTPSEVTEQWLEIRRRRVANGSEDPNGKVVLRKRTALGLHTELVGRLKQPHVKQWLDEQRRQRMKIIEVYV